MGRALFAVLFLSSCASGGGVAVRTLDSSAPGVLRCLGLESHEIATLSRRASADLQQNFLAKNPSLLREGRPLRVVIDTTFWTNDAAQQINLNMVADQLSTGLQRQTRGKLAFLSREHLAAVEQERALKRSGAVDKGALGLVGKIAGADYRMVGRLTDHSTQGAQGKQRGTTLALSLVDLETGAQAWSWQFFIVKESERGDFC